MDRPSLGSLFERRPMQWGLRGDSGLWDELKMRFADTLVPSTFAELWQTLEEAFLAAIGQPLTDRSPVYIKRFDRGGMSSGYVSPETWATKLFPLISQRYAEALCAPDREDQHRMSF